MSVTGEQMRKMLEEIVGQATADWDDKGDRLASRIRAQGEEIRDLTARVQRLERINDRLGKTLLQEKP